MPGAAGTIYLKSSTQTYPDLIVDNGGIATGEEAMLRTSQSTFRSVQISGQGRLAVDASTFTIQQSVAVSGNCGLRLGSSANVTVSNASGFDIQILSGSTLTLDAGATLIANAVRINASTLNTNINLSYPTGSDFELSGNGTLNVGSGRVFSIGFFNATNIISGTINLPPTSRLDIVSNTAVIGSTGNTVTLMKDGTFGASDQLASLTIGPGGTLTHSYYTGQTPLPGLVLNVTGTLDVQGSIDVDDRGLRGGSRVNSSDPQGETYDPAGTSIVRTVPANTGGGYGGFGGSDTPGTGGQPNGTVESPDRLGSGGGGRGATFAGGGTVEAGSGSRPGR